MRTKSQPIQLQLQALYDLTMRAKAGIYIYIAIWLIFVFAFDFLSLDSTFVYINTAAILIISTVRLIHWKIVKKATEDNTESLYQFLILSVLASGLHWGVLTSWMLTYDQMSNAVHLMLIVLPAFAMGGASTLSISNTLRILYPLALYTPPLMVFFYFRDPLSLVYALAILCSYIYVIAASKASRENYWSAIKNHQIAEERATELEELSSTDQLTQLKNRMYFDSEYHKEWLRAFRLHSPLSVIMIDFDSFKKLNDTYGHLFGDEVLRRASAIISNELSRPTDFIARYGGEEFVALLPNTDANGARTIGERIRKSVEHMKIEYNGKEVPITCSVGGASVIPTIDIEKTVLIKHADSALYQAKDAGRNRYRALDPEVSKQIK